MTFLMKHHLCRKSCLAPRSPKYGSKAVVISPTFDRLEWEEVERVLDVRMKTATLVHRSRLINLDIFPPSLIQCTFWAQGD